MPPARAVSHRPPISAPPTAMTSAAIRASRQRSSPCRSMASRTPSSGPTLCMAAGRFQARQRPFDPWRAAGIIKGSRRRRWQSTIGAMDSTSAQVTAWRPSRAAAARPARISVSSPRIPSMPSRMHSCDMRDRIRSGTCTWRRILRAATTCLWMTASGRAQVAAKATGRFHRRRGDESPRCASGDR